MRFRATFLLSSAVALLVACDVLSGLAPTVPTAEWPEFAPVATLPDFGGTWSQGPVGFGQPLTVGSVEVQVNEMLRPADTLVIHADSYPSIEPSEQFAMVDVSATCRADAGETCNVTEMNFSLLGDSQKTYYPEFAMTLAGLNGLFDGGQIPSGETWSGDVVFVLDRDAVGLTLRYSSFPGGPGPQGLFTLEP